MKLSIPNPTSEMLPANAPATNSHETFKAVPGDGEVFQSLSAFGYGLAVCRDLDHLKSLAHYPSKDLILGTFGLNAIHEFCMVCLSAMGINPADAQAARLSLAHRARWAAAIF
jgi:hypothetical protein